jgi:hypothetical protein
MKILKQKLRGEGDFMKFMFDLRRKTDFSLSNGKDKKN